MSIKVREIFPTIEIEIGNNRALLNQKAKEIFENDIDEIPSVIKDLDLSKKMAFSYIGKKFYAINIIKGLKFIYLLFTEIEDAEYIFNSINSGNSSIGVSVYSKEVLREFLEKFLSLKRRYGGFHIKFLYLRINFVIDVKKDIQKEFVENILKYTVAVTRSSDVVGQIDETSFGIILTNSNREGANIVAEKITKYIADINFNNDKRIVDANASLAHEMFILKHSHFNELIKVLDENANFITVGTQLKELIK